MSSLIAVAPAALAAAALAAGCSSSDKPPAETPDGGGAAKVTYYQDLKPLIDARCVDCHNPDGIAPFALQRYEDVIEHVDDVLANVHLGVMPPWPPDDECNEYVGDRSLSEDEKALFARWDADGRERGDAAAEGPPMEVERVELTRVDLELAMPTGYMPRPTDGGHDDYRCFVLPWPELATTYVTGFRAIPGEPKAVHHVIAFLAQPGEVATYEAMDEAEAGSGYTCFGGTGGPSRSWLGAWAPGSQGNDTPAGTGLRVEPGSAIVLQVHYNTLAGPTALDTTAVQFKLDDVVEKEAQVMPWANPGWLGGGSMMIPAGDDDVMHAFQYDAAAYLGGPFVVHAPALHMHTLGTSATASIVHPDGTRTCLLDIPAWDFHWQGSYGLRTPVLFNPGDELRVECHWDNSAENQPEIDGEQRPPADVTWGEGTADEMCLAVFYVVPE